MKSIFRTKAVPRTPGPNASPGEEDGDSARLRLHSEETNYSNNSLDSPASESPRSWPSSLTTPMSYIKDRKKRKASRFHIASPLETEKSDDVFGAEEHNLSQSIHSDSVSFVSFSDSPAPGEEEGDGAAASRSRHASDAYHVQMQQLKLQVDVQQKIIADFEKERSSYEKKVGELSGELDKKVKEATSLREELHVKKRLEICIQDLREKLKEMEVENRSLQQRLNEAFPLTDHQKELLLENRIKSCSAPPSIMAGSLEGPSLADSGEELSFEWEVKSSGGSSVHSQVSVACLQDKLVAMEENNYSTHEELQATLQELTDLQHQLEELQSENRTLGEEKALLYESLCQQTEKLEACRSQLESTRQLLLKREDQPSQSERETQLLDVLKSAQDERDRLDAKGTQMSVSIEEYRVAQENNQRDGTLVQERMAFLEKTLHTIRKDKEHAEREANDLKGEISVKNMEMSRLQTLNENFKTKLEELEAARDAVDKTEIEAKLDELRKEKNDLETALAETSQQRDKVEFELGKLKDASLIMKQESEFQTQTREKEIGSLKEKLEKLCKEKAALLSEIQILQNTVTELEVKCQHHLTDKRELRASLSEIQKNNSELQMSMGDLENQLSSERTRRVSDAEEWKQFQSDLLMTVRVANDFQTEAQTTAEAAASETSEMREKLKQLEVENDKLKKTTAAAEASRVAAATRSPPTLLNTPPSQVSDGAALLRSKYLAARQCTQERDNKATVKGLIDSIETAAKARTASYARSSSTPALPALSPIAETPLTKLIMPTPQSPLPPTPASRSSCDSPLMSDCDSPVSILTNKNPTPNYRLQFSGGGLADSSDPLAALVKNGGSKRNALLKWCQSKTMGFSDVDITNFSSSWNDGMAICAILNTYIPDKIPYHTLKPSEKRRNFTIAFEAAESVGIPTTLNLTEMVSIERPDWQQVMTYVTNIYKFFET